MIIRTFTISLLALILANCGGGGGGVAVIPTYDAFTSPEQVTINGYSGDIMEPFMSRDDQYLFFNNNGTNKDIYFASYDSSSDTFTFEDVISNINTPAVEGVPTLDSNDNFYYISTFNYPPGGAKITDTIYKGTFDPLSANIVDNLFVVQNLDTDTLGELNFDVEVNPEGTILYFVDGVFSGNPFPDVSNFVYATGSGTIFTRAPDSDSVFANINTVDLEYAACISANGLEFFFTRLYLDTLETDIMRATRPNLSTAFSHPQRVSSISGFVEAPTLSMDEKTLYYHRRNESTNTFELYRVTRP